MKILVSFFAAFLLLTVGTTQAQATAANSRVSAPTSTYEDQDDLSDLNDDSDEFEGMVIAGSYTDFTEEDADFDEFVLGNDEEYDDLDLEMDAEDTDLDDMGDDTDYETDED